MEKLTKAEEDIMQLIWANSPTTVSDLIQGMDEPKPPHSSISSVVRILEKKGFVGHKAYGRTYEYFALIKKEDYAQKSVDEVLENYYDGSVGRLVSALVQEEKIDAAEMEHLKKLLGL